jgi:UDP-GlcNAc:undecaprenyl-phosphate GlcNAc-1-phosphate transferase
MNFEIYPILIIFLFNLVLFFNHKKISSIINVYDHPDQERKKHLKSIPLLGGGYLLLNIIIIYLMNYYSSFLDPDINSNYLVIFSICVFIVGILDDKFDLKVSLKFSSLLIIILILIILNEKLLVKNLHFDAYELNIFLGNYSFFFTVLCFLLFLNACNMFDGINLQLGLYSTQIFIFFIINNIFFSFSLLFLIYILFFIQLNKNNKIFFGDSGSLLVGFIIAFLIISKYNSDFNKLNCEIIFILMLMPGLDMFRLFLIRIFNKKNPFKPDRNHIHHLLINKFSFITTTIVVQSMTFFGLFISNYLKLYLVIILMIFSYLTLIFYLEKKTN